VIKQLMLAAMLATPCFAQDAPTEREQLKAIWDEIQGAQERLDEAQRLLVEFALRGRPTEPPVDPPVEGLPSWAPAPPPVPEYAIPTMADCEWIIEERTARSTRGLPDITLGATEEPYLLGKAYKASRAAGHPLPITFGVYDDAGVGVLGGGWSLWSDRSIYVDSGDGYEDLSLEIVGLDPICEVSIGWDVKWGWPERLGLFNIGLRGAPDSFVIRANEGIGTLIVDGCWFLPSVTFGAGNTHASGIHMDNWHTLVLRNTQWRGVRPEDPGINLREHVFYLKSCIGDGTWILDNDLRGGNRTGFQIRPEFGQQQRPRGPVVISGNVADGYGWNMGDTPSSFDGGSCITVWTNPEDRTWIFDNRIVDAKYGGLMVGGQPTGKNWLNAAGFPIHKVYVWGNTFENSHQGHPAGLPKRSAASLTAVEGVHWGVNDLQNGARLDLNSQWGMQAHGIGNGLVQLHLSALPSYPIWTYDGSNRPMTPEELTALLVPPGPDPLPAPQPRVREAQPIAEPVRRR